MFFNSAVTLMKHENENNLFCDSNDTTTSKQFLFKDGLTKDPLF